jgi:diaminohydroxyphosphoribosylaminopyrimidine deaminase / 5-amino-6-(5-phosphoribosylamino)uracil reductase
VVASPTGVVVGQGAHLGAGLAHAEVVALDMAGARARGATLYCTLEPCCHTGRTGPCVERIVAAGISRVVVAMEDPNPRVRGGGARYLRAHGVEVAAGEGAASARRLIAPFVTWIEKGRPHVTLKTVVSSDGFVGPGDTPVRLTGPEADRYFHRERAEIDAVAVGANTVLVDDPLLTPRLAHRARPLIRVIVDWRLRVPPSARVFSTLDHGPVGVVSLQATSDDDPERARALEARGARTELFDTRDLPAVLARLGRRGILSLLVEGGPMLQAAFLEAGLVDCVQRVEAPVRLGRGVAACELHSARAADPPRRRVLGRDTLVEWDVVPVKAS